MDNIKEKDHVKDKRFWFNLLIKILFLCILIFFLYRQLFAKQDIARTLEHFYNNFSRKNFSFLVLCIFLMPANWMAESKKWQLLVQPFEEITFKRSLMAILSGISFAMLTPNRIGEYGGRIIMIKAGNNWKGIISTLLTSYAQNIWNIGIGLIGASIFFYYSGNLMAHQLTIALSVSTIMVAFALICYFNIHFIHKILNNWQSNRWIQKLLFQLNIITKYSSVTLLRVLMLSLARYLIYFLQYYLILNFFGLDIDFGTAFIGIATIFLIQTSIPLPPVLGFVARGEIALMVWSATALNELSILAATYSLWILNLIIPAVFGAIIILKSNLWSTLGLKSILKDKGQKLFQS